MFDRKYNTYALSGPARAAALQRCYATVAGWGLKLPPGEPLALDFGLGRFDEIGEIEFWIANEPEAGYCGKYLFVADGQTCPAHHHAVKHETFFLVKGRLRLVVDGETLHLEEGERLAIPPGRQHAFTAEGPALLLEVSMPSVPGDNFFDDRAIGVDGTI